MPSSSYWPIFELLTRHGVDHDLAKSNAKNVLRHWELDDLSAVLQKVQRPSRDHSYFRDIATAKSGKDAGAWKWWQNPAPSEPSKWVSPPRAMMQQSAQEETALCVNMNGQWSLRTSGYVALSHVWIEGLQRNKLHQGLSKQKVDSIFALLYGRNIDAEWIWTDALAIPSGGDPETTALEDDMLTIDIINAMHKIYSHADAVLIIDALVLQIHTQNPVDVAVAVACGKWVTRVWTYQEIKLASRALILTASGYLEFSSVVNTLSNLKATNHSRYHSLWLKFACMMKDEAVGISIPDIIRSCTTRKSGQDVDYARAFFPVLHLKWEFGMTREEGMQTIYSSYKRHASTIACLYGAPRLRDIPAWAPSSFNHLEGSLTDPMQWEERGIRGEWYAVKVGSVKETFFNGGRLVVELVVDCLGSSEMQCALAPNEPSEVRQATLTALERVGCYVLSEKPSLDALNAEFARIGLLVERAAVNEDDGFEAAVFCAVIITTSRQYEESRCSILLRHWSPIADENRRNQLKYLFHTHDGSYQTTTSAQREDESQLHAAVRSGDLAKVVELTKDGKDIESFDGNGWTPLHIATTRDNMDILRYLLSQNPRLEICGKKMIKDTPLSYAAFNGQADAIEILLNSGANVHARNDCDYTPIMVAASERHAEAVGKLLSGGANPNDATGFRGSALLLASGSGRWRLPTLRALIEGGADVKPRQLNGFNPMLNLAKYGGEDEMVYLIEQGCEVDSPQFDGFTPLATAIKNSKKECVKLLLDAGADRNRIIPGGFRPIHLAARCPNWQIMQMLLEKDDVQINARTHEKRKTALHLAWEAKNMTIVKILMKHGGDATILDADGRTPQGSVDAQPTGRSQMIEIESPPLPPRPTETLLPQKPSYQEIMSARRTLGISIE